ncbi:MAG: glycosyltransferase [Burkholderiales bacterium]
MRIAVDMRAVEDAIAQGHDPACALAAVEALVAAHPEDDLVAAACCSRIETMLALRRALRGRLPAGALRGFEVPSGGGAEDADAMRRGLIASLDADATVVASTDGSARSIEPRVRRTLDGDRPKLYYVSPLPPERTGIAAYSAQFLPYLAAHYDVEVVVADEALAAPIEGMQPRSATWLAANARAGDRVLYHMGNSAFHVHMPELLDAVPGVVVLHDFFLGHLAAHREGLPGHAPTWTRELCHAHGYHAVRERYADAPAAVWAWPASLSIVDRAQGVIVHSPSAKRLALQWYGEDAARKFDVVPMPRARPLHQDRDAERRALGLDADAFVVCAFGMLGPSKHNEALVEAWRRSSLARDARCRLVFVGENPDPAHAARIERAIRDGKLARPPRITGWVSGDDFERYLTAADAAVQLRTSSRGETSAAALDCMAHGLATIVNANGSFGDLPRDAVVMLPDEFDTDALRDALEALHRDAGLRARLASRARDVIAHEHDPVRCAEAFRDVIEDRRDRAAAGYEGLVARAVSRTAGKPDAEVAWAQALAATCTAPRRPRLFLDVSITCREDLRTGIQRVVRAITLALVRDKALRCRAEPIYASDAGGRWHFRHARRWTARMLDVPAGALRDDAVEFQPGDTLLSLDLGESLVHEVARSGVYRALRARGVSIGFVVYDTLPLAMPEMFPPGRTEFARWFASVAEASDFVVGISRAVASDVEARFAQLGSAARVGWFHLGADVESSAPTRGRPADADRILRRMRERRTFLMVGTVEPRKGYQQAIEAFTQLWAQGADVDLVIVGSEGWRGVPPPMRRTIPAIVERLRTHPEHGQRLLWIDDASDEFLADIFASASALVAASEGEGFGLPLVEAARHGLPIVARDLAVFREVAGEHALYFAGTRPEDLAAAVSRWLAMRDAGTHPRSEGIALRTWEQSARDLVACIDTLAT